MNTSCTHPIRYATDLSDAEWAVVAPYVNADPKIGSPRSVCMRCVVNALFYLDKTGCQWQMLPSDFSNYGTVYYHFRRWTDDGTLERMNTDLRRMLRTRTHSAVSGPIARIWTPLENEPTIRTWALGNVRS